jgi:hypothetical protein
MNPEEVEQLADYVRSQLSGRIDGLRLLTRGRGLVLRGRAHSYYAKQLAQELIRKVMGFPPLANEITMI